MNVGVVSEKDNVPSLSPSIQVTHSCAFPHCSKLLWSMLKSNMEETRLFFSAGSVFLLEPVPSTIIEMTLPAGRNVVAPRPEQVSGRQIWAEVPAS